MTKGVEIPKDREIKKITFSIPDPLKIKLNMSTVVTNLSEIDKVPEIIEIDYPKIGTKRYKLIKE